MFLRGGWLCRCSVEEHDLLWPSNIDPPPPKHSLTHNHKHPLDSQRALYLLACWSGTRWFRENSGGWSGHMMGREVEEMSGSQAVRHTELSGNLIQAVSCQMLFTYAFRQRELHHLNNTVHFTESCHFRFVCKWTTWWFKISDLHDSAVKSHRYRTESF